MLMMLKSAGEKLQAKQEPDNLMDKFAVKVTNENETVSHLPLKFTQILWYFLAQGGKISAKVISCRPHCQLEFTT